MEMSSNMRRTAIIITAANVALALCQSASSITVDTVAIGNPGNPADLRYIDSGHPNGFGSVAQPFRMGRTEITNAQYVQFLNAVAGVDPYELYKVESSFRNSGGIVRIDSTT